MPPASPDTPPSDTPNAASMDQKDAEVKEAAESTPQQTCNGDQAQDVAPAATPAQSAQSTKPSQDESKKDATTTSTESPTDTVETSKRRPSAPPKKGSTSTASHKISTSSGANTVSEWSHQQIVKSPQEETKPPDWETEWQEMPAYAPFNIYNDDGKLIALENEDEEGIHGPAEYAYVGGPGKGYTRVQLDEDAQSATSMDDNTAYLFKETGTSVDDDEDARDAIAQMKATKDLLSGNQRIAYVGVVRLAMSEILEEVQSIERTKISKKTVDYAVEAIKLWSQKMMVRLYSHMELEGAEQVMIEQLAEHGLRASDLSPALMQNARVKNPGFEELPPETSAAAPNENEEHTSLANDGPQTTEKTQTSSESNDSKENEKFGDPISSGEPNSTPDNKEPNDSQQSVQHEKSEKAESSDTTADPTPRYSEQDKDEDAAPPPYEETQGDATSAPDKVQLSSDLPKTENIDIDIRWTVLCDLFLILISDSMYDSRSRVLFEKVGSFLKVSELDICRFEKRVTEALEMEEEAQKEDWNESTHIEARRKAARKRRLAMMGLATVGGGLVIGLSAGLLAPLIGAGLASGFTLIGVTGTSGFLGGVGGAAVIGSGGVLAGSSIGVRAAGRRTGSVKTFEYRPLHNNKRVNLIVTVAGWMNGKVDDVRLPFSTVDQVMGDMYSVLWEPEMLRSMGDTINILATEALTQGLQQLLGSTILISLMAALQLPIVLTKLSYLIDNPWSNSLARADAAGLILADSLIDRNLGARPITLVGFSIGSRLIFTALKELADRGAVGLVHNVVLFGSPVVARKDDYLRARTVVSGKFINGYATNDWILGYLFRATAGGIGRVAGLAKVEVEGIENIDVTEHVPGHMAYRQSMPKLLRQIGWLVTSDEFTEIEDPDPDNHERRQRELINEIEEARKEIQEKKDKKKFGIFSMNKKRLQKREWETYDERLKGGLTEEEKLEEERDAALFDIDAIRKEAAQLAAEGIEIKELQSTMPPLKVDSSAFSTPPSGSTNGTRLPLRETQSYEGLPVPPGGSDPLSASRSYDNVSRQEPDKTNMTRTEEISMSFDPAEEAQGQDGRSSIASTPITPSPSGYQEYWQSSNGHLRSEDNVSMTFESPQGSRSHSPAKRVESRLRDLNTSQDGVNNDDEQPQGKSDPAPRPTPPAPDMSLDRNVWADEEDEAAKNKGLTMTFE